MPVQAGGADVAGVVEGTRVKPEAVYCSAEVEAFRRGQKTAVLGVVFPFPRWIHFFPFLGCGTHCDELLQECKGKRNITNQMSRLTCVVSNNLDCVLKGAEIRFGGVVKDRKSLGCGEN